MNYRPCVALLLAGAGAMLSAPALAADPQTPSRWFFHGSVGVDSGADSDATQNFTLAPVEMKFNTGARAEYSVGFWINPQLGVSVESGLFANSVDSIAGSSDTKADLAQFPVMGNLIWRPLPEARVAPVLGIGAGVVVSLLDVDQARIQGTPLHGRETAWAAAGQAFAGVEGRVGTRLRVGALYKYQRSASPEWDLNSFNSEKAYGVIKLGKPSHQALMVTVSVDF